MKPNEVIGFLIIIAVLYMAIDNYGWELASIITMYHIARGMIEQDKS